MKLDNIRHIKQKKELFSITLFAASVLFAVLILIKVTGFFTASAKAENLVQGAIANGQLDPEEVEKHLAQSKTVADELKKNNLFVPPSPKTHPVKQVSGILGDEVLINGKWYKAGDKVGDAEIVVIEPTQVKIKWDGKEKVFDPFSAAIMASTPAPEKDAKQKVAQKKTEVRKVVAPPGKLMQEIITVTPSGKAEAPFVLQGIKLSQNNLTEMSNGGGVIRRYEKKD